MRHPQHAATATIRSALARPVRFAIAALVTALSCAAIQTACKDTAPRATAPDEAEVASPQDRALRTPGGVLIPEGLPPTLQKELTTGVGGPDRLGRTLGDTGESAAAFAEALLASPSVDDVCIGLKALTLLAEAPNSARQAPPSLDALINHTAPAIREQALALASAFEAVSTLLPRLNAPSGVPLLDKLQIARLAAKWPGAEVVAALTRCVLEAPHKALAEVCAIALTTPEHAATLNGTEHLGLRDSLRAMGPTFATMIAAEVLPTLFENSALLRATESRDADAASLAARLSNQHLEETGDPGLAAAYGADERVSVRRSIADYSLDLDRVQVLSQDDDPTVRAAAIGNLARLTPSDARAALLRPFLSHPVASTRLAAVASIAALAPLGDAVEALSHYLGQAPEDEQPVVLAALRTIPAGEAVDALIAALGQPATQPAAWYALISLTGEEPDGDDPGFWRRWRDKRYRRHEQAQDAPAESDPDPNPDAPAFLDPADAK